jgi:hypothetical protein
LTALAIYVAGLSLIAFVAWTVSRPFFRPPRPAPSPERDPRGSQKRKQDALSAIRDAEFDFQLGKLSETDYRELRGRLEREALDAIARTEGEA